MTAAEDDLLRFAEDPFAYASVGPDEERMDDPRFVITFSPGIHFWSTSVGRLRLAPDPVAQTISEIRSVASARDRRSSAWTVGDSATPPDLATRLTRLGLERMGTSDVLVLTQPPRLGPASAFEARIARTLDDHLASIEITISAFGFPPEDAEDERARAEHTFRAERAGNHTSRVLALDDGRPVATGRAWFSPWGLHLGGGATLPSDRARGAMTSLVAAAWEEAVRRATPALVTHGGEMASPVLAELGFEKVGQVVHLVDRG